MRTEKSTSVNFEDADDFVLDDDILLLELVKAIVSSPDKVKVVPTHAPEATVLTIYVDEHDRGQVIGKEKRTIAALEHLFSKVAFMSKHKVHIQLGGQENVTKSRKRDN